MAVNTSTTPSPGDLKNCALSSPNQDLDTAMTMPWLKARMARLYVSSMAIGLFLSIMLMTSPHSINSRCIVNINFHRPCYFPSIITDKKGKQRKRYRYEDMMTPYEKLCSLQRPSQYLKSGISLKQRDAFAKEMNDNEAAEQLNSAKNQLFKQLHERLKLEP